MLKDLQTNAEDLFALKCIGIAAKLEFQGKNTPHHHIVLWLEGGIIENPEKNDSLIMVQLPLGCSLRGQEHRELVKKFKIHSHSAYCRGTTQNGTCWFGYDKDHKAPETRIDDFSNDLCIKGEKKNILSCSPIIQT